mgnify:CR=1 FL=1
MKNHSKSTLYKPTDENMGSLRDLFLYRQSVVDDRQYKLAIAKEKRHISSKSEADNFIYRNSQQGIDLLTKSIQECERRMLEIIKEDEGIYRNYQHLISCKGMSSITSIMLITDTEKLKAWCAKKVASYSKMQFREEQVASS